MSFNTKLIAQTLFQGGAQTTVHTLRGCTLRRTNVGEYEMSAIPGVDWPSVENMEVSYADLSGGGGPHLFTIGLEAPTSLKIRAYDPITGDPTDDFAVMVSFRKITNEW